MAFLSLPYNQITHAINYISSWCQSLHHINTSHSVSEAVVAMSFSLWKETHNTNVSFKKARFSRNNPRLSLCFRFYMKVKIKQTVTVWVAHFSDRHNHWPPVSHMTLGERLTTTTPCMLKSGAQVSIFMYLFILHFLHHDKHFLSCICTLSLLLPIKETNRSLLIFKMQLCSLFFSALKRAGTVSDIYGFEVHLKFLHLCHSLARDIKQVLWIIYLKSFALIRSQSARSGH